MASSAFLTFLTSLPVLTSSFQKTNEMKDARKPIRMIAALC